MFCLDQNVSTMQFMEILNQILQGVQSFHATVTLISIWYQSRPEGSTQQRTTSCQMQEGALAVDGTDTGWRKSKRKLLTVCVTAHVHYTTCHTHTLILLSFVNITSRCLNSLTSDSSSLPNWKVQAWPHTLRCWPSSQQEKDQPGYIDNHKVTKCQRHTEVLSMKVTKSMTN